LFIYIFSCQDDLGSAFRAEIILAYTAEGANIIIGQILKGYAVVLFGIIDITAYVAYILFHGFSPLLL
jgi:hypothetical protein